LTWFQNSSHSSSEMVPLLSASTVLNNSSVFNLAKFDFLNEWWILTRIWEFPLYLSFSTRRYRSVWIRPELFSEDLGITCTLYYNIKKPPLRRLNPSINLIYNYY
jgi:hypothetical protein